MKRLLVTGASGLLGINLALRESTRRDLVGVTNSHSLIDAPFESKPFNLAAPGAINRMLDEIQPGAVIHCAAMADIDACEKQPEKAALINTKVPGILAQACAVRNIRLVHLSTALPGLEI